MFSSIGPVAGWEKPGGTLRLLGGVAWFQSDEGDLALGVNARLDVSPRPWGHLAPVFSVRTSVLPSFEGAVVGLGSIGIGARIQ
ncbi:MAG: hypothetical protein ACJ8GN_30960 [Longimicrobiaceae bacterium]